MKKYHAVYEKVESQALQIIALFVDEEDAIKRVLAIVKNNGQFLSETMTREYLKYPGEISDGNWVVGIANAHAADAEALLDHTENKHAGSMTEKKARMLVGVGGISKTKAEGQTL